MTNEADNTATEGNGRGARGRFAAGNKIGLGGNPAVRHLGALQTAVRAAITPEDLTAVLRKLHGLALAGDVQAIRVLLERCLGRPREEPSQVALDLEGADLSTAAGIAMAQRRVAEALASGELSTADATAVSGLLRQVSDATVLQAVILDVEAIKARQR